MPPEIQMDSRRPVVAVVNDDMTQCAVMAGVLRRGGFTAATYPGAEAALESFAQDGPPDLIITDLRMPNIDGWRFCRLLRSPEYKSLNPIPILVVSATFSGDEVDRLTSSLGANAFLSVPVEPKRLLETVQALLKDESPHHPHRVLIVEDNHTQATLLHKAFDAHGCHADIAGTLCHARQLLEVVDYSLVLADYHLPDGHGSGLLKGFRKKRPNCVFIMMTADPSPALGLKWMKQGAAAYVRKPFSPDYIIELFEKARREQALLRVEDLLEERTRELQASEALYRTLFDAINDAVFVHELPRDDQPGRFLRVNDAACRRLGYSREELLNLTPRDLTTPEEYERVAPDRERLVSEGSVLLETFHITKDGRSIPVESSIRCFQHLGNLIAISISRDISERKRAEAARMEMERRMQHVQKLESLGVLAGGIAHDFNNILMAIMGHADLALLELPPTSPGRNRLAEIVKASARAAELCGQMLAYSGRGSFVVERVHLGDLISEMVHLFRASISRKVTLNVNLAKGLPPVEGDATQIRQILMNLITNASEAIGDACGEITVTTGSLEVSREYPETGSFVGDEPEEGFYVFVEVSDSGCGMSPKTLERIFEPFFTTKFTGRGLGMAAVLGIIRGHRGFIQVNSKEGSGSTFRVLLPATRHGVDPSSESGGSDAEAEKLGGCVLLVDDEAELRDLGAMMLERLGFKVIDASDGREALEVYSQRKGDIDLVLLDLTMPRMDGEETFREILNINPDAVVIMSSGYSEQDVSSRFSKRRPAGIIQKPYTLAALEEVIRKALGR